MITTKPGLNLRQTRLLAQIRKDGGQWPTGRALTWYQEQGLTDQRSVARGDLERLAKLGYLTCLDGGNRWYYVLSARVGVNA